MFRAQLNLFFEIEEIWCSFGYLEYLVLVYWNYFG
jgi:hypothetical protein